ncbi:porin [Comamonas sp. w2-DMI]|uniref:porin n=1 Tax=Comamonas TaxID=283 RepID=UPI001CCDBF5D|nr:porin [Comamonas thiooxydans]UBQ41838.1 porin [Comamonas thiooxydans]
MKKTVIAATVLATAGFAHAQSSVTIFGVVDVGISHYSANSSWHGPGGTAAPDIHRSQTALSSGANSTSRIGFRGKEDLGNGWSAGFWLESGFTADNGAPNGLNFDRRSTVSLSAPFGEIRLGRDYTPTYWNDTSFDPFGPVGVGTGILNKVNQNIAVARASGTAPFASDNAIRANNSVGYFLPRGLGGIYGQAMYVFDEGSKNQRGRYLGGRLGYASGAFDMAVSYAQSTGDDYPGITLPAASLDHKIRILNLGASYDLKVAKLMGAVTRTQADIKAGTSVAASTYNGMLLGVSVPVGSGVFKAAYSRMKSQKDPYQGLASTEATAQKLALGYVHNLSKRTALYTTVSRVWISNGQNDPVILGLTTGGAAAYQSTGGYAPHSAAGYEVGLRHSF